MLVQAASFLIGTLGDLLVCALLLRFLLQWRRAASGNPLAPVIVALTDFMVRPARRVIPGLWGFDLSTLVLAWLTATLEWWLLIEIGGHVFGPEIGLGVVALGGLGLVRLLRIALYILMIALALHVALSWLAPYNPLVPMLDALTRPLLRPLRRVVPKVAQVDFTLWIAFFICQLLLIIAVNPLEILCARLLSST